MRRDERGQDKRETERGAERRGGEVRRRTRRDDMAAAKSVEAMIGMASRITLHARFAVSRSILNTASTDTYAHANMNALHFRIRVASSHSPINNQHIQYSLIIDISRYYHTQQRHEFSKHSSSKI